MRHSVTVLFASVLFSLVSANPLPSWGVSQPGFPVDVGRRSEIGSQSNERRGKGKSDPEPSPCLDPPSTTPKATSGTLQIFDGSLKRDLIGYVSMNPSPYGAYGLTQNFAEALFVKFDMDNPSPAYPHSLLATNGAFASTFPSIGGVVGEGSSDNNFYPGSYNYAVMAGTNQTFSGSPPVYVSHSITTSDNACAGAIWNFNPTTRFVTPKWINSDVVKPATYVVYVNGLFVFTGDVVAFQSRYGGIGPLTFILL